MDGAKSQQFCTLFCKEIARGAIEVYLDAKYSKEITDRDVDMLLFSTDDVLRRIEGLGIEKITKDHYGHFRLTLYLLMVEFLVKWRWTRSFDQTFRFPLLVPKEDRVMTGIHHERIESVLCHSEEQRKADPKLPTYTCDRT